MKTLVSHSLSFWSAVKWTLLNKFSWMVSQRNWCESAAGFSRTMRCRITLCSTSCKGGFIPGTELCWAAPKACGVNNAEDWAVDAAKNRKKRTAEVQNRVLEALRVYLPRHETSCGITRLFKILFPAPVVETASLLDGIN
jgi:hypothetical protein